MPTSCLGCRYAFFSLTKAGLMYCMLLMKIHETRGCDDYTPEEIED